MSAVSSLFIITRTSSRVVAPRASALLLLLMHVNNNDVSSTHMFNVVLQHALSSFIIRVSAEQYVIVDHEQHGINSIMSSRASSVVDARAVSSGSSASGHH